MLRAAGVVFEEVEAPPGLSILFDGRTVET